MVGYQYKFTLSAGALERRKVVCPLCRHVMREPVRITSCGHRYCDNCLQDYLRDGVFKCPQDNVPLDYAKIYSDPEVEESIMALSIKCIHHKDGCKWQDKMKHLQTHLLTCKYNTVTCTLGCGTKVAKMNLDEHVHYLCSRRRDKCDFCQKEFTTSELEEHTGTCPFEVVYCECKCGAKMQRRFLANHTVNECPKRSVLCKFCDKQFVYETLQNHLHTCPRYPISCPNRCSDGSAAAAAAGGVKVAREEMEAHLLNCPSLTVQCQFKQMGCNYKGARQSMQRHLDDACQDHLKLLCDLVLEQRELISKLTSRLQEHVSHHHVPTPAASHSRCDINVSPSSVHSASSSLSDTSPQPPQLPAAAATDGTLLWKIEDFSRRLEESRRCENYEIRSPVFTTSRYGYKLQASIFPNGNGSGEGSHVSVYIRILPGEYDALLQWPFTRTISFTLYDQCNSSGDRMDKRQNIVESFVPDPNWNNFQRPAATIGSSDSLGFGFPQFVGHEVLRSRSYVRDDVMFVKVRVDYSAQAPPPLPHGPPPARVVHTPPPVTLTATTTPANTGTGPQHIHQLNDSFMIKDNSFSISNRTNDIITNIG